MTKINLNKKDLVSIAVGAIGGTSTAFAAYVTATLPIMIAEQGGTNKGLINIAKFGALVGSVAVGDIAGERLYDMINDRMENGITLGIKKVNIDKNGVELEIGK